MGYPLDSSVSSNSANEDDEREEGKQLIRNCQPQDNGASPSLSPLSNNNKVKTREIITKDKETGQRKTNNTVNKAYGAVMNVNSNYNKSKEHDIG